MKLTQGQKWIYNRLKDFGFNPDAAGGTDTYYKALRKHLGLKKREEFLDRVDDIIESGFNVEERITEFIGTDLKLLKLVVDIHVSMYILDCILDLLDDLDLDPSHVLELGGANGWALALVEEFLETDIQLSLIERNVNWDVVNEKISVIAQAYKDSSLKENADFAFSIFGAPADEMESLFQCAKRNLALGSYFIAVLRIPNNEALQLVLEQSYRCGFALDQQVSCRVQVNHPEHAWHRESFPVLVFKKELSDGFNKELTLDAFRKHKAE